MNRIEKDKTVIEAEYSRRGIFLNIDLFAVSRWIKDLFWRKNETDNGAREIQEKLCSKTGGEYSQVEDKGIRTGEKE